MIDLNRLGNRLHFVQRTNLASAQCPHITSVLHVVGNEDIPTYLKSLITMIVQRKVSTIHISMGANPGIRILFIFVCIQNTKL